MDANIGPQRGPASVSQVEAQAKAAKRDYGTTIERLREIRRRCKRLQITVGDQVVRVELDSRCEVRVSSDGPVTVTILDGQRERAAVDNEQG